MHAQTPSRIIASSVAGVSDPGTREFARRQRPASQRPATVRRRGFTLLECVVAGALMLVVLALATQLFLWDSRERREVWRRQVAQQEAANALERLSLAPYDAISTKSLAEVRLSEEAQAWLPEGAIQATASDVTVPRTGRRIDVQVRWGAAGDAPIAPVRLSGWRFAPGGAP